MLSPIHFNQLIVTPQLGLIKYNKQKASEHNQNTPFMQEQIYLHKSASMNTDLCACHPFCKKVYPVYFLLIFIYLLFAKLFHFVRLYFSEYEFVSRLIKVNFFFLCEPR